MSTATYVIDTSDRTFLSDVIERSKTVPVVVDFWAEWCGPCRQLGPTLERLAEEYQGRFVLAKLNVDENPMAAQQFQVSGIPAVKAFKNGQLVAEFTGALPEPQVRAWLAPMLPSRADDLAAYGAQVANRGELGKAEAAFREALDEDPDHVGARSGLAAILVNSGALEQARELLKPVAHDPRARRVAALIRFRESAQALDEPGLAARLERDPKDAEAHYMLAQVKAARGEWPGALDHLLEVVRLDRKLRDDAGRRDAVEIFDILGDADPVTKDYRQRLSMLLF